MALSLTEQFVSSYRDFATYPANLNTAFYGAYDAYQKELDFASDRLFSAEGQAHVPFRDLNIAGVTKRNVFSDEQLKQFLGDTTTVDAQGQLNGCFATVPDPSCRFIFLWGQHARAPLNITRTMLMRILTYYQVMPRILDFLLLFGRSEGPRGHSLGEFRHSTELRCLEDQSVLALRRSGRRYQVCYNFIAAERSAHPEPGMQWSIRRAAIYHSFDLEFGTSLWIVAKGNLELKERIQNVTGPRGHIKGNSFANVIESFSSCLAIHSVVCYWAILNWRWYVQGLENEIKANAAPILRHRMIAVYQPDSMHKLEEKANQAVAAIEANVTVMRAIKDYYEKLSSNPQLGLDISGDVTAFNEQREDNIKDLQVQRSYVEGLIKTISREEAFRLQTRLGAAYEQQSTIMANQPKWREKSRELFAPLFRHRSKTPSSDSEQQQLSVQASDTRAAAISHTSNTAIFHNSNQGVQVGQNMGSIHNYNFYSGRTHEDEPARETEVHSHQI